MQLTEHRILGYIRYVDGIRIVCNINGKLSEFSTTSPKVKFTLELGENCKDITIMKSKNSVANAMYRKPTAFRFVTPNASIKYMGSDT